MGDVARDTDPGHYPEGPPPEPAEPWPDALTVAEQVLADMRGGDLFDVSPDRSARIIAKAIADAMAAERARIVKQVRHWVANGRDGMPDDPEGIGDWIATEIPSMEPQA